MSGLDFLSSEWFWSMANFLLLLISALFIYRQINLQWKSHLLTTIKDLDDRWSSDALLLARNNFCERWLANDHNPDPIGEYIAEFFELLAIYSKRHAISNMFLWDTFSFYIENYYLMLHDELFTIRVSRKDPSLYKDFEDLYKKAHEKSKGEYAPTIIENKDLTEFASREIRITSLILSSRKDA